MPKAGGTKLTIKLSPVTPSICIQLPVEGLGKRRMENQNTHDKCHNNEKFRSFKSIENIYKKEVGPYHGFGYLSLISDPINLAKGARGKYC